MLKKTYVDKNLINKEVHVDSRQNGNPHLPPSDLNNQETFINRKLLYEKSLDGEHWSELIFNFIINPFMKTKL